MNIVELFAGCGGSALGFSKAGFKHVLLVEKDKNACLTLSKAIGEPIPPTDVTKVDFSAYRDLEVDVLMGGIPCQSFSSAGKRLGMDDIRGTLFYDFVRALITMKPKLLIIENVKGLTWNNKGETLKRMLEVLADCGYQCEYKVLNAAHYEVPQKRQRLFIIGLRDDLNGKIYWPSPIDRTVTLREALKDVPDSPGTMYSEKKRTVLAMVPEGGNWRDLPPDIQQEYMGAMYHNGASRASSGGGRSNVARRLAWDKPSLTLTTSPSQKMTERCHPDETRPLTIREYARIQTFPDSMVFIGSISSQYRQIGNAVPPKLAFNLAKAVKQTLDKAVE